MEVFAAMGFAGASIDAIAEAAGFTKGAVYSNFGSKDDLFFALLDDQIERRRVLVEEVLDAGDGTPDQFGQLLMEQMRANRSWQLLFTEYWLRAVRDPAVHRRFLEHRRALRENIEAVIRERWSGVNSDPAELAMLVLALNNGLSIEEFSDPGSVPPDLFGHTLQALIGDRRGATTE